MYELLYIVPAPLTEKDFPIISTKVKDLIEKQEGKILEEKNLGQKRLAYEIKRVYQGFYLLLNFEIDSLKIKILNEKLKQFPEILRHLIIKKS